MIGSHARVLPRHAVLAALTLAVLVPAALIAAPPAPGPLQSSTVCTPAATVLCLNNARFRVEVHWQDFQGRTGLGQAVPLTGDTGYFWFFSSNNIELAIKVLDARGINGNFWVFYGALSNVEYDITVTDTTTEAVKTYSNPAQQFASVGDTGAFPSGPDVAGAEVLAEASFAERELALSPEQQATSCAPDATALCLSGGRYRVEVNWKDFKGRTGRGQAVALTADTGYFWFFSSVNVELVVKVLDARVINQHFWVFYGALSNVEYELIVEDTETGESKRYRNPASRFASAGDTSAFPVPPGTVLPLATAAGTPTGTVSTFPIGPAGGFLASADGVLTLTVPPAALTGTVDFTIQPITNETPGGSGIGYRLGPDGQTFKVPAQLSFRYDDPDPSGTLGQALGVAYQDAQGYWRSIKAVDRDANARTLTVSTTHLSDWGNFLGYALSPRNPHVSVSQSLGLQLVFCKKIEEDDLVDLVSTCDPQNGSVRVSGWATNGIVGGTSTVGTVGPAGDYAGTFTAPDHKPTPSLVDVSAQLGGGTDKYQVVSNVTIVDDSWKGPATGSFGPISFTSEVTWTAIQSVGNVTSYSPSGTVNAAWAGCTLNPSTGSVAPNGVGLFTIDSNTDPPTYDGIATAGWVATVSCPGENPSTGFLPYLIFDARGLVSADGKTMAGSGKSRDGVWDLTWNFTRQ